MFYGNVHNHPPSNIVYSQYHISGKCPHLTPIQHLCDPIFRLWQSLHNCNTPRNTTRTPVMCSPNVTTNFQQSVSGKAEKNKVWVSARTSSGTRMHPPIAHMPCICDWKASYQRRFRTLPPHHLATTPLMWHIMPMCNYLAISTFCYICVQCRLDLAIIGIDFIVITYVNRLHIT